MSELTLSSSHRQTPDVMLTSFLWLAVRGAGKIVAYRFHRRPQDEQAE